MKSIVRISHWERVLGCGELASGSAIAARTIGATSRHHWYANQPLTTTASAPTARMSISRATRRDPTGASAKPCGRGGAAGGCGYPGCGAQPGGGGYPLGG